MNIEEQLFNEFKIKKEYINNIISLIDEDNTIPFIARYRKEKTGSCDDQVLRLLNDRLIYLRNLSKRTDEITTIINDQGKMTKAIEISISMAKTLTDIEDIYRPFKKKKSTRASIAKEKGLEELAKIILNQEIKNGPIDIIAQPYLSSEKGVLSIDDALMGAKDIIAEYINDDSSLRKSLRYISNRVGILKTKNIKKEESVYELYYDYKESLSTMPGHRVLAINRGEKEKYLRVNIEIDEDSILYKIKGKYLKENRLTSYLMNETIEDSWNRLIKPSIIRELRNEITDKANTNAIRMFSLNLKPLLLQPPIKGKVTLGLDPAYRTGCKIAVVDSSSKVLDTTVIYPTPPKNQIDESKRIIKKLINKHNVSLISIGNGTASKESEIFISEIIKEIPNNVEYLVVNESGASVYSASKLASLEFPEYDVSIRSAVSIARRLQDPLAELVKIDPKSIGVGQYQHDMPQMKLDLALKGVVEDCVNSVGVNLNTASVSLLKYISGLNETIAKNIIAYREENGRFINRTELKKVKRLGKKSFEQSAGFLRIEGENLLDNTAVHPESYKACKKLLNLFDYDAKEIGNTGAIGLKEKVLDFGEIETAKNCDIGLQTLRDIVSELQKPGRDIRDDFDAPILRSDLLSMSDLKVGMELLGTIRNVIDFGAFVDIGVHQDGLVHISELCDHYVKHPLDVVKVGDKVKVYILSIDEKKKRIALTMKNQQSQ